MNDYILQLLQENDFWYKYIILFLYTKMLIKIIEKSIIKKIIYN